MILAIDMGNTNIVVGGIDSNQLYFQERITTTTDKTDFEFAMMLDGVLKMNDKKPEDFDGAILSSVVPGKNKIVVSAIKKITGLDCIVVTHEMKMNIEIAIDEPAEAGADLIVDSCAAAAEYPVPSVVIDMGTATTMFILDKDKRFIGGTIHPGIRLSLGALANGTSQLPDIEFVVPEKIIGTNTVDCMLSGVLNGHAGMIDGILNRMEEEIGQKLTVIATGGIAQYICPLCKHEIIQDDGLLLKGLYILYSMNS